MGRKQTRYRELEQIIEGFAASADILAWAACCLWGAKRKTQALQVLGQAIELRPDAPELLWQRASYLREVGNDRKAIEDLMYLLDISDPPRPPTPEAADRDETDVLDLPGPDDLDEALFGRPARFCLPEEFRAEGGEQLDLNDYSASLQPISGINPYVVSALWQLREMSSQKYEEAKQKASIKNLSPEAQKILFADPSCPEKQDPDPRELIRVKKWGEVVTLLERRVKLPQDAWSLGDSLHLFMAYWALGDDQSLRAAGERAKEQFRKLYRTPGRPGLGVPELQMMSLVLWKTGNQDRAEKFLTLIDWEVRWPKGKPIFSYWWYECIPWELFKQDCQEQRQMFRGAKVRPPVLEPETACG